MSKTDFMCERAIFFIHLWFFCVCIGKAAIEGMWVLMIAFVFIFGIVAWCNKARN